MDIGHFASGLSKANRLLGAFKRGVQQSDVGNGVKAFLGVGGIIQGFRMALNAAQDARAEAKELGITLDSGTASVAAYADRWDQIKGSIGAAGIAALSFFTRTGRAIGQHLGTGSSDEEVTAIDQNNLDQKQREKDLKANGERIARELEAAKKERTEVNRNNALADLSPRERALLIEQEINELYSKRANLLPSSLAAVKADVEIGKKTAELRQLNDQIKRQPDVAPSERKGRGAFGLTLGDVARGRSAGRSERERLAAQVVAFEERGKRAEATGNFSLAKSYRERGKKMASGMGFNDGSGRVEGGLMRGGNAVGPRGSEISAGIAERNARMDAGIAARNGALTARYGGDYQRPASFSQGASMESSADKLLSAAATKLEKAAVSIEAAMKPVD